MMYDSLRYLFLPASITLFANVPDIFEMPMERIGFGAILFFIIWTYIKHVLPKTQEEMERKNHRIAELIEEIRAMNKLREQDQKTMTALLKDLRQSPPDTHRNHVKEDDQG
jgi:hypothetical protein